MNELDVTAPASPGEHTGATFGRFQIGRVLGRGGIGVVMEAVDPDLDRRVAIKVLRASDRGDDLQREAQAMAKLAHPNVVAVYEVGRSDDDVFVVMELVAGTTLRGWLDARARSRREVLAMFVAAGRGLAAAHAAGLVHRDFKPENVLIGDGRPRVSDFGLATDRADGRIAGTPAYMAPEQWTGGTVDARSDQFAFCVALWTALWGEAPFAGDDEARLRAAVIAGERRPPPARAKPRWLVAALQRGLAWDPDQRWPDLASLLAELERRRLAMPIAIASAGIVAAGAVLAVGLVRHGGAACAAPNARIDAVWGPARRAAIEQHVIAVDAKDGARRFAAVAAVFDRDVVAWSDTHVAACRATRDGEQSDALLDRRMQCLDGWLARANAVAERLAGAADARRAENAVIAARQIGDVSACSDLGALSADVPPAPPAIRDRVAALHRTLLDAERARLTGHFEREPQQSADLVAQARALDYAPALADALRYRARVQASRFDRAGSIATERELVDVAARAKDDRLAADTWLLLVGSLSAADQPKQALDLVPAARAAVARAGDDPLQRAMLLYREGAALHATESIDAGIARLEDARKLAVELGGDQPGSHVQPLVSDIDTSLGDAWMSKPEPAKAVAAYERAIAESEAAFGPDNADETFALNNISIALLAEGKAAESLAAAQRNLVIKEAHFGQTLFLVPTLGNIASALRALGKPREALVYVKRAQHIDTTDPNATPIDVANGYLDSAVAEDDLGDDAAALADYNAAIAIYEKLLPARQDISIANAILDRAEFYAQHDRCADALPELARALRLVEEWRGKDFYWLVQPLEFIGRCHVLLGHPADAIAPLERAAAMPVLATFASEHEYARYYLARARATVGRDRAANVAEARAARAAIAGRHPPAHDLALVDAWLAKQ